MRVIRQVSDAEDAPIDLTPIIDLMFTMVIFLFATTTFTEEERDINVKLPETSSSSSLSTATKVIVINVRGNVGEGDPVYTVTNQPTDLGQLRAIVGKAVTENVNQKILIRGDKYAFHGNVANAVGVCREVGIQEVNIGYDFKPIKP